MKRTSIGSMILALALTTSLAACGSSSASNVEKETSTDPAWQEVLDGAYEEGQVSVYNAASKVQNKRMQEAWEEKYPQIDIKFTNGAAELVARVGAEIDSGSEGADAFMWSDPAWFEKNSQYLADLSNIPSAQEWDDDYWAVKNKAVTATKLPWSMMVWNTDKFPEGFESYEDLLAPEVKGKLGTRSEVTVSIAGYLDFMEAEYGDKYMHDLAAQQPKFYSSVVPLMQAVASGEIGVSNVGVPATVLDLQEAGAPLDYKYVNPGFAFEHAGAALTTSAHPNAALLFLNWFMSQEGQQAYNGDGLGGAGRDDVDGALNVEGYTMLEAGKYSPDVVDEWKRKFHGWFG
jgi:iron(III) transport system substrate-binding protein